MKAQSLKDIEIALSDLTDVCKEFLIDYRVIGSTAMVANSNLYRIPADVDVLFDEKKKKELEKGLLTKGYRKEFHSNKLDQVITEPLVRFIKNNSVIEPRGGSFKESFFETTLLVPIPFLPLGFRPKAKLVFSQLLFRKKELKLGTISFFGLSKEALLFIFSMSKIPLVTVEGITHKRELDEANLSENYDKELFEKIQNEASGVYLGRFPLISHKNRLLLKLLTHLANK